MFALEEYDSAEFYAEKAIEFEDQSDQYIKPIAYLNYGLALEKRIILTKP